jgi:hypothetical protein
MAHLFLYKNNSALPIMVAYGAAARLKKKNMIYIFCKRYLNTTKWIFYAPSIMFLNSPH